MKNLLKLEDFAFFVLGIFFFSMLSYTWWWFIVLFFLPDIFMVGYLINPKIGAWVYNLVHHYGISILLIIAGYVLFLNPVSLAGAIILSHVAFDRLLGFGLKYETSFNDTHLGKIGKK